MAKNVRPIKEPLQISLGGNVIITVEEFTADINAGLTLGMDGVESRFDEMVSAEDIIEAATEILEYYGLEVNDVRKPQKEKRRDKKRATKNRK